MGATTIGGTRQVGAKQGACKEPSRGSGSRNFGLKKGNLSGSWQFCRTISAYCGGLSGRFCRQWMGQRPVSPPRGALMFCRRRQKLPERILERRRISAWHVKNSEKPGKSPLRADFLNLVLHLFTRRAVIRRAFWPMTCSCSNADVKRAQHFQSNVMRCGLPGVLGWLHVMENHWREGVRV